MKYQYFVTSTFEEEDFFFTKNEEIALKIRICIFPSQFEQI